MRWMRVVGTEGRRRCCCVRAVVALVAALAVTPAGAATAASSPAHVAGSPGRPLLVVPPSFLGVSVEQNELLRYDHYRTPFLRLLRALQPPGDRSPMNLRIGGESADSSFWGSTPFQFVKPAYVQDHPYLLTPAWMTEAGALVKAGALKVIFDLNLAAHSPTMAAAVASAAWSAFPRGSITDFEIGNEPDLYRFGLVGLTQAVPGRRNTWAYTFGIPDYLSLFGAYTRTLQQALPVAKFAGPAGDNTSTTWVKALGAGAQGNTLSLVTEHYYPPFAGCVPVGTRKYPSAKAYLQDAVASGFARGERPMVNASHALGLPVRLTETGSSVCGGIAGQTDTFATALWAPDMLFNLLSTTIDGVNVHLRANSFVNTALLYADSGLYTEPLFYGLVLFARALGPGAELIQTERTGGAQKLKVWIVRRTDGSQRVVYINKSSQDAYVTFPATRSRSALLDRLSAPSITANGTVTFDGQRFDSGGRWHRSPKASRVRARGHAYTVLVPKYSAALLSVPR
jgi:hypothetical protein